MSKICLEKNTVYLILFILFLIVAYYFVIKNNTPKIIKILDSKIKDTENKDIIKDYDYKKIIDPLENPTKRVDRNALPNKYLHNMIDISTRGNVDNFQQIGVLVSNDTTNELNKVIRLFGRKEYPNSNKYEYYVMVNNGNDSIKLPINNYNKEINNNDEILIDSINKTYKAVIYNNDSPRYYPVI